MSTLPCSLFPKPPSLTEMCAFPAVSLLSDISIPREQGVVCLVLPSWPPRQGLASGRCCWYLQSRGLMRTRACAPHLLQLSPACVLTRVPQALVTDEMGRVGVIPGGAYCPSRTPLSPK